MACRLPSCNGQVASSIKEILRLQTRNFDKVDTYGRYLAENGLRTAVTHPQAQTYPQEALRDGQVSSSKSIAHEMMWNRGCFRMGWAARRLHGESYDGGQIRISQSYGGRRRGISNALFGKCT
jgi:hypothetical protein